MVAVVEPGPAPTPLITGGPTEEFCTVTVTAALVAVWPPALRAAAVRLCWPFGAAVVSQEIENGAEVISEPRLPPSSLNCTPTVFAEAFAETVADAETVAPDVGEVIETVGPPEEFCTVTV